MSSFDYKEIRGFNIRGEQLHLQRAISIFRCINALKDCSLIACKRKSDNSEVIILRLSRIEIPDEPAYDIHSEEDIAIVCNELDLLMPEVYALRPDFPLALPHSNARKRERPVSLCVSDVPFADIRHQFSAYDFISLIRRWFTKNSMNELHEEDRPVETFFVASKACELRMKDKSHSGVAPYYVELSTRSDVSYTLTPVEKNKATHFNVYIQLNTVEATNFAAMPETVNDLMHYRDINGTSLPQSIVNQVLKLASSDNTFCFIATLFIKQRRKGNPKEEAIELFAIPFSMRIWELRQKHKSLSTKTFMEWFGEQKIEMMVVCPQPSVNQCQVCNNLTQDVSKVSVIGTGTLGANIVDCLLREGFCHQLVIVDFDIYYPHNVSRHILPVSSTMEGKAIAIKRHLNGIENQKIIPITSNIFRLNNRQQQLVFDKTDLLVDASTSVAVERFLADSKLPTQGRRCTLFLNPKGDDLVLLFEDAVRTNRLDLLEMSYLREVLINPSLERHLDVSKTTRVNDFSCRAESAVICYDNVKILSGIASQQIKQCYDKAEAMVAVWHINEVDGSVEKVSITAQHWKKYNIKDVSVFVACDLIGEIKSLRFARCPRETGGCLYGGYDKDRKIIYVLHQVSEPKDSVCTPCSFIRGCDGMEEASEIIYSRTGHQVRYLGEWHSHPNGAATPSDLDKEQYRQLSERMELEDVPFVQMIFGNEDIYVNARL